MARSREQSSRKNALPVFMRPQGILRGFFRQYILQRIAEKPVHGYKLLREIDIETKGAWRPSAGSIYPILRKLLAERYIAVETRKEDGRPKRVYRITRKGAKHLQQRNDMVLRAGKNFGTIRPIMIELIPPRQVPTMFTPMTRNHFDLVRGIVESKKNKIPPTEVKSMLKEYVINLEKQLNWARQELKQLH